MRYKLGQYQDQEKHRFTGEVVRFGSYVDRETGKKQTTILFKDIKAEDGKTLTDHAWVKEDSYIKGVGLKKGKVYSFEARVGIYNRGRTAKDYQLKKVRQMSVA